MKAAEISACGRYRYTLTREWLTGAGTVLFVMLNPSTADASQDDRTIGRCIGFAQRWGYQRLAVVNLFALRSRDPDELLRADDPVGPDNDGWIGALAGAADLTVCAWGAHKAARAARADDVMDMLADAPVYCLGTTAGGLPNHPLYLPGDTELEHFGQALERGER